MQDLYGKTFLITGSTDGLGKVTARRLAARGAEVILHGRDDAKGKSTLNEIRMSTGNDQLRYYNADLASLDNVRMIARRIAGDYKKLDVLINNAGIGGGPRSGPAKKEISTDGHELRFAVNYLSHFVLTYSLLPLLRRSQSARIINVASIGQEPIDFRDVMLERGYNSFRAYRQSKLAQIMFTIDLADELRDDEIVVNSIHPATLMNTNMVREYFGSTMTTVDQGADALEYVATSDETAEITGAFFHGMERSKAISQAYDLTARERLRNLSIKLAGMPQVEAK